MAEDAGSDPTDADADAPPKTAVAKRVSRRKLLIWGAAGTVALAVPAGLFGRHRYIKLKSWAVGEVYVEKGSPTGAVKKEVMDTLTSAVFAVIGMPVEPSHYVQYFEWRAANLPGYRSLYERFAQRLESEAAASERCSFASADENVRKRVLERVIPRLLSRGWWAAAKTVALAERDEVIFYRFIIAEALVLFGRTDAFVHLGYGTWAGVAAGLTAYTRPPEPQR